MEYEPFNPPTYGSPNTIWLEKTDPSECLITPNDDFINSCFVNSICTLSFGSIATMGISGYVTNGTIIKIATMIGIAPAKSKIGLTIYLQIRKT